ncbi:MAG: Mycothiol maleylpyruvate isomerase N-terminal domain, partial [Actinomycetota bacterium]|nr:Mycothiol maleylpyruvate isomerase N-terminal domain [Actinomycetota bacterium]
MLQRVVATTTDVIGHTTKAQLSNPTLCTEWTVNDVINHMVTGATMFAISAEQGSIPDDVMGKLMSSDNVGDDPKGAWDAAASRALTAFEQP